jgi:hypothetical protein
LDGIVAGELVGLVAAVGRMPLVDAMGVVVPDQRLPVVGAVVETIFDTVGEFFGFGDSQHANAEHGAVLEAAVRIGHDPHVVPPEPSTTVGTHHITLIAVVKNITAGELPLNGREREKR